MPGPCLPVLLIGLACCQAVSRTGQRTARPHPFHQLAPRSLPWILKQTGCVLWLPPQPKGGGLPGSGGRRGGRADSKHPRYVNNQDSLTAHLIFCHFISVTGSWEAHHALSPFPGTALGRVPGAPAGTLPGRSPVTATNSRGGKDGIFFFLPVPRLSTSCSLPKAERQEVAGMGSGHVSDLGDWNVLPGSPLYPPAPPLLSEKKTQELPRDFCLGKGRRGHGEWHRTHQVTGMPWAFWLQAL